MVGKNWGSQAYIFPQVNFSLPQSLGKAGPDSSGVRARGEIQWMWSAIWPCLLNSSDGRLKQQEDVDIMIHNVYYTITHGSLMLFPEVS